MLLLILVKFVVKNNKSVVDRDIDKIVFCPSKIPHHVIEAFKQMKDDSDCKKHATYDNDAGSSCIRFRTCQDCPTNGMCDRASGKLICNAGYKRSLIETGDSEVKSAKCIIQADVEKDAHNALYNLQTNLQADHGLFKCGKKKTKYTSRTEFNKTLTREYNEEYKSEIPDE